MGRERSGKGEEWGGRGVGRERRGIQRTGEGEERDTEDWGGRGEKMKIDSKKKGGVK